MICPHCNRTIHEQKVYLMSQRTPKGEPLADWALKMLIAGSLVVLFIMALFVFYLLSMTS